MLRAARTSPEWLVLATIGVVAAGVLAGLLGVQGLSQRASGLERARFESQHRALIQLVLTKLVVADTAAGDVVLEGPGVRPGTAREFTFAMEHAMTALVVAARQEDDGLHLALADRGLQPYLREAQAAMTLAGQGDAGRAATSLAAASRVLRTRVLPQVRTAQAATAARLAADESSASRTSLRLVPVALIVLVVFGGTQWWLSRRTRRVINVGLVSGFLVLAVVSALSIGAVVTSEHRVAGVRDGPQRVADALVDARVAAFDARAAEALGVVTGRTASSRATWDASMTAARSALVRAGLGGPAARSDPASIWNLLGRYATVHDRLLSAARAGNDQRVRTIAASRSGDGAAGSFEDFDAFSGAALASNVQAADDGWAAAGRQLRALGLSFLLAGLAAAWCGWAGLAARRREYR